MVDPGATCVRILTLGCRLNQAESEEIARSLSLGGIRVVDEGFADVTVVNTCAVTHDAAKSSRKLVRKAVAAGSAVVVTGCYATASPEQCASLPGVTGMVSNEDKHALAESLIALPGIHAVPSPMAERQAPTVRGAFGVQTGCDSGCTFCAIPMTRGELASRNEDSVIEGIRAQVRSGVREVALTGVNLGRFGADEGRPGALADLVRRVLAEVPDLPWLRLSSIEAVCVTDDLLDAMASDQRVCRHLHIPLQSGDDATLAAMGRPYSCQEYAATVRRVRASLGPDVGVTADVLVGFPGETDASFEASAAFVRQLGLSRLHVFRYSSRPGTPAAKRPNQVPEEVKKERSRRMRGVGDDLARAFGHTFLRRKLLTMIERADVADGGHAQAELTGTATNYLKVTTTGHAGLVGSVVDIEIRDAGALGVAGVLTGSAALD